MTCPRCRLHPPAPSRGWCPSCLVDMGLVRGLPSSAEARPIEASPWTAEDGRYITPVLTPMIAFSDRAHRREQTVPWDHAGAPLYTGRYCQCRRADQPCQSCREAERWREEAVVPLWRNWTPLPPHVEARNVRITIGGYDFSSGPVVIWDDTNQPR